MKKVFVQCPLCREQQERDDCALATVRRAVGGKVRVYCCESQAKKDKQV